MPSAISNILHRSTRGNRPLNVLSASTHERYQGNLLGCNAIFYLLQGDGLKDWKECYAPLPKNHILLDVSKGDRQLLTHVDFDLVLSQNKFGQFQVLSQVAKKLQLPLVSIDHTLPQPNWRKETISYLKTMRGDINLFISEYSREMWGWGENEAEVVHHGIDSDLFKPTDNTRENVILSVVNDWINRDECCNFSGWRRITNGLPTKVLGNTPGLSLPAKDTETLAREYSKSRIFLNTSTVSPIPMALLEGMSSGCACVSTANCMIPEIIQDGVNGFLSNDEGVLRKRLVQLMNEPELAKELGDNARKTVLERFSMTKFVRTWDYVFERASNIICRGF